MDNSTETKTVPSVRVRKSLWRGGYNWLVEAVNYVLIFFSLRKPRKFWGVVYDAVSKQPLDPVIVKLVYTDGETVETNITDLNGHYGFLARPGKFKILVKKTNYSFPSLRAAGDSDGIYDHLYHGEFFQLDGDYEVVAPNIPMDPQGRDWNQNAKLAIVKNNPYLEYLFKKLVAVFFWFGFLYAAYLAFAPNLPHPQSAVAIFIVYLVLIAASLLMPRPRLLGKIKQNKKLSGGLLLELSKKDFPNMVFGKTRAIADGRFFLRAKPGSYNLLIKYVGKDRASQTLGSVRVRVNEEGVINDTLLLGN